MFEEPKIDTFFAESSCCFFRGFETCYFFFVSQRFWSAQTLHMSGFMAFSHASAVLFHGMPWPQRSGAGAAVLPWWQLVCPVAARRTSARSALQALHGRGDGVLHLAPHFQRKWTRFHSLKNKRLVKDRL